MHDEAMRVLEDIRRWHEDPGKLESLIRQDREYRVKLPPQITWTLLGLIRYRQRNRWMRRALRRRGIAPVPVGHSPGGSAAEKREQFIMPGGSEWSCHVDGDTREVTNRVTGERLHDLAVEPPNSIFSLLFREHIVTGKRPSPTQCRLLQLFPNGRGMVPALYGLRAAGMFRVFWDLEECGLNFKLCHWVDQFDQAVRTFLKAWADESNRTKLGALIGDHIKVAEVAAAGGDSKLAERARAQAADSQRRWLSLLRYLAGCRLDNDLLWALVEAEPEEFLEYLPAAMSDTFLARTAEEILESKPSLRQQIEVMS